MFKPAAITLALVLGVAGCSGGNNWRTDYQQIDAATAAGWRVADVQVTVPETLTISEENRYMPNADIVWHGDPAGDRRAQVAAIVRDSIRAGAADLKGPRPVVIGVTVDQFHALTPRARAMEGNVGVHDIRFTAVVADARTGEVISAPQLIEADKAALVGNAAAEADARGHTQKVEITQHLTRVVRNWLGGHGEDPRGSFARTGR